MHRNRNRNGNGSGNGTRTRNHREEGVRGNIEGDAKSHVARALIHLAGQLPLFGIDIELAEHVAWGECHDAEVRRVPSAEEDTTIVGVCLDGVNNLSELVHSLPRVVGVHVRVFCSEVTPLGSTRGK